MIAASAGARKPAVFRAAAASAPGEGAHPNMSDKCLAGAVAGQELAVRHR